MQDVHVAMFFLLTFSSPLLFASPGAPPERDPFTYDYESLKIAGLIVAGVLCAMGIIILISGKCRCKFNQKKEHRSRSQDPALITPGSASHC
ncbi:LOW QUALITY PROTEIN: FXYD domain-containing ion transport regulator 3-like [Hyla sarda]|uniref:LOW QUALITY PROTEIN: FXYD domain-containing ion transport regulator 3-like n=1 Tax=Hyla sarda TaxID=327740 RepID=UPI0024C43971|nr:LOW QUALITY PROTEIN: FXYD domain-containing ion transport regulator 3-like [Hyla sarda]